MPIRFFNYLSFVFCGSASATKMDVRQLLSISYSSAFISGIFMENFYFQKNVSPKKDQGSNLEMFRAYYTVNSRHEKIQVLLIAPVPHFKARRRSEGSKSVFGRGSVPDPSGEFTTLSGPLVG